MAASRRKGWDQLSPGYRARLEKAGVSKSAYDRGQSLARARGHLETPEHGRRQAEKNPVRYRKYLGKREPRAKSPEDEAYELNKARDRAYAREVEMLRDLLRFNEYTVFVRVYGGIDAEGREHTGQTLSEAKWTSNASRDAIRGRASLQDEYNVWWYH
jgi:hypothetical protein